MLFIAGHFRNYKKTITKFFERYLSEAGILLGLEKSLRGLWGPLYFRKGPWQGAKHFFKTFSHFSWRAIRAIELLKLLHWPPLKRPWPFLGKVRGADGKFSERYVSEAGIVLGLEKSLRGLGGPLYFRKGPWQECRGTQMKIFQSARAGMARDQASCWFLNSENFSCAFYRRAFSQL